MYNSISNVDGSVPEPEAELGCFGRFLKGQQTANVRQPQHPVVVVIPVHSESIRLIAYVAFWIMCFLAFLFTKRFIPPEIIKNSVLMKTFGFNNICAFWDYTPSRELTAMFYPLFEYSFLFYVIFDYIQTRLYFIKDMPLFHRFALYTLPIKILLIAWFRMIFVYQVNMPPPVYEPPYHNIMPPGVVGHSLGFFGMQFCLILVAFQNVFYILATRVSYPYLGERGTAIGSYFYLACIVYVTFFKIYSCVIILSNHDHTKPVLSATWFRLFHPADRIWMLLVALMPLYFTQIARRTEPYIKVTLELGCDGWNAPISAQQGI